MATQGEEIATLKANYNNLMKEISELKDIITSHVAQEDLNYKEFMKAIKEWQEVADKKFTTKEQLEEKLKLPNLLVKGVLSILGIIIVALVSTGLIHLFPNINI